MTPKQQYEARKAERNKLKDMDYQVRQRTEQLMLLDILDRFTTAVERIADTMNMPSAATTGSASGFAGWPSAHHPTTNPPR